MTAGFEYVGPKASPAEVEGFFHADRDAVLQAVKNHPGAVTKLLASILGWSASNVLRLLKELEERGQVERRGTGSKTNPISWLPIRCQTEM